MMERPEGALESSKEASSCQIQNSTDRSNAKSAQVSFNGKMLRVLRSGTSSASKLFGDFDALSDLMKLVQYTIASCQLFGCGRSSAGCAAVTHTIVRSADYLGATRVPANVAYLSGNGLASDRAGKAYFNIGAKLLLSIADLAGAVLWLQDMGVKVCAQIAAQVGRCPVLARAGLSLAQLTRVCIVGGLALTAIDLVQQVTRLDAFGISSKKQWVSLGAIAVNIGFHGSILFGVTNPMVLAALGVASAAASLFSFFYPDLAGIASPPQGMYSGQASFVVA